MSGVKPDDSVALVFTKGGDGSAFRTARDATIAMMRAPAERPVADTSVLARLEAWSHGHKRRG